ncbi:PHP-associated domain-containing protein [Natronobiforma cellulositropha]|uniref:PHP-associated domain-containing protein n=1 Tax=Natronobiforma cellulositropha TaxID=1679076 RepID=UPI0021D5993A|nr:PHP-associated domain-containing protein [Natronobiforma cellulositropha]
MTDREFRADLHVKVLSERVVERAIAAGLDAIVYAPHFTRLPEIRRRAQAYSSEELLVVPAREVFTGSWRDRKHVLALGLTDPVPDFISLEAAMAAFERQGAAVLAPHPEFLNVSLTQTDIATYRDVIDAVEVYNPKHLRSHNRRARELADSLSLPPFSSSYAHLPETVGVTHTAFDADLGLETEADLVAALRGGVARRVVYENGHARWLTSARELAHLCYENTWQKVDRLFLQGTEPTHPEHIAYRGAFDDVSVY